MQTAFQLTPSPCYIALPVTLSPVTYENTRKHVALGLLKKEIALSPLNKQLQDQLFELAENIELSVLGDLPHAITQKIIGKAAKLQLRETKNEANLFIDELIEFAKTIPYFTDAGLTESAIRAKAIKIATGYELAIRMLRIEKNSVDSIYQFIEKTNHTYGLSIKLKRRVDYKTRALVISPGDAANAVKRLIDPATWTRRIRQAGAQARELILYKIKLVGKNAGQFYASKYNTDWRKQCKENTQDWAQAHKIFDEDGNPVLIEEGGKLRQQTLADCIRGDEARFSELYTVFAGIEKRATKKNMTWSFVTATLPGEWHANPEGETKTQWNGKTPRDGADRLLNDWALIRALTKKSKIEMMGLRVAEPQQDGTPHLHLMIFHHKKDRERLDEILKLYWGREQITKPLKRDKRWDTPALQIVSKNENRGSAASYIMKYLAKGVSLDAKTIKTKNGKQKTTMEKLPQIDAWRAIWGIRAFQFFGVKSALTLWKALRVNRDNIPRGKMFDAWYAAQGGLLTNKAVKQKADFCAFLEAVDELELQKLYETTDRGTDRLSGFMNTDSSEIVYCRPRKILISKEPLVTVVPNGPSKRSNAPPPVRFLPPDGGSPSPAGRKTTKMDTTEYLEDLIQAGRITREQAYVEIGWSSVMKDAETQAAECGWI